MKHGLTLPTTISASDIEKHKRDPRKFGIEQRIAMFKENNVEFEKMLDTWHKSGHTVELGEELILNIRGEK